MTDFNNGYNVLNTAAVTPAPVQAAKPRKGRVMAMLALIIGIVSSCLGFVTFFAALLSAYTWKQMAVIRITACSSVLIIPLILAIVLAIIASARGAGLGKMIATVAISGVGILPVLYNIYLLIYYIGMVY